MSDKNVCPYCGGHKLQAERYDKYTNKKVPHQPNVGYRGRCNDCGRDGPWIQAEDDDGYWYYAGWELAQQAAINAFCHPAHLHEYDPQTQIVVSREAGEHLLRFDDTAWPYLDNDPEYKKLQAAIDELEAALEVKP